MYYGRKKGIFIVIAIIIAIIIAGIVGVVLYLYTDLFKSNDELFFKYIGQSAKSLEYTPNKQLQEISSLKSQNSYTITGKINFSYSGENETIEEILPNMQINTTLKSDILQDRKYGKAILQYENDDIFNVEYANSNNIYAIKSDEIVTAFIGVRNENLEELVQKLGIIDTTITLPKVSSNSSQIDYTELLKITSEEKQHIKDTYLPVITSNISKENYTKQKNIPIKKENIDYNTTAYRLELTAEEISNIMVKILETLKEDSITLNMLTTKAKILGLSEEYTKVNNLTQQIDKQIKQMINTTKSPEDGINIIVYEEKGQTVLSEVIIKNEAKITIYGENKEIEKDAYILIENLSAENDYTTIELQTKEIKTDTDSRMQILINKDNTTGIEIYVDNTGTAMQQSLTSDYEIVINQDANNKLIINYTQDMVFEENGEILGLDNTNCAVLNDYPAETLSGLMQAIGQRVSVVMQQKIQQITNKTQTQQTQVQIDNAA